MALFLTSIFLLGGIAFLIRLCYVNQWACPSWMGFNSYIAPNGDYYPAKTLWDWLELLIVPIVLGLGAYWFSYQDRKKEYDIAQRRQYEQVIASYLEKMADLMLTQKLRTSIDDLESEPRNVAQALTITSLRILDLEHQNTIFSFLRDTGLDRILNKASMQSLELSGAKIFLMNLDRANLWKANLYKALLFNSSFESAILYGANLSKTDLSDTNLKSIKARKASFEESDLRNANFANADLREANFTGANIKGANLEGANLAGAKITSRQLEEAVSLSKAILPEGVKLSAPTK